MLYSPSPDFAAGPFIALSLFFGIIILTVISFIEAGILKWLKWKDFKPSFRGSFVANFASAFAGFFLWEPMLRIQTRLYDLGYDSNIFFLLLCFIVSVLIEGVVIYFFKRSSFRETVIASFSMNAASYILIIIPAYYFLLL